MERTRRLFFPDPNEIKIADGYFESPIIEVGGMMKLK